MYTKELNDLLKAYDRAIEKNDTFSITIIYTRIRNLGYDFIQPIKQ